jgi:hypothetical protein
MNQWIPARISLPPEGVYVLVHLTKDNWFDESDQVGVKFKTAKLVKGISQRDREMMERGLLPNPLVLFYGGESSRRSKVIRNSDESGNNLRPYTWEGFGSDSFWGQEVDYWMHIAAVPTPREDTGDAKWAVTKRADVPPWA